MPSIFGSAPILAVVAIQLLLIPSVVSSLNVTNEYIHHACNNTQGKFKPGSVFEKNLNIALKNISAFNLHKGFALDSNMDRPYKNIPPDTAFVMLQCRGDSYGSKCRSCLATALSGLRKKCPRNKAGTIWYDQCTLDISTYSAGDSRILYDNYFCKENPKDLSGDTQMFIKKKVAFTEKLLSEVKKLGKNGKGPLYATGETMIGTKKLYGMMQYWIISEHPLCGREKQGVRYLCRSCNARFELYPFLRT
ncbi:BnaC03g42460D [Brassica napus]|uniref:BnaC03g42460D protein n=1 Tax=Brassica napus TaxID=3708 RepID=A0A078GI15_BRANA|nr:BnaC03g42460D [Brassica napus]